MWIWQVCKMKYCTIRQKLIKKKHWCVYTLCTHTSHPYAGMHLLEHTQATCRSNWHQSLPGMRSVWLRVMAAENLLLYIILYFVNGMLCGHITYPKIKIKYIHVPRRDHLSESRREEKFKNLILSQVWRLEPKSRYQQGHVKVPGKNPSLCLLAQGCQTRFHQGPHQPCSCLQRAECNFNSFNS